MRRHRAITSEEAKNSILTLARMIHEKADELTVTERESLANAVVETIMPSVTQRRKKPVKNMSRRPSKIIRSI